MAEPFKISDIHARAVAILVKIASTDGLWEDTESRRPFAQALAKMEIAVSKIILALEAMPSPPKELEEAMAEAIHWAAVAARDFSPRNLASESRTPQEQEKPAQPTPRPNGI